MENFQYHNPTKIIFGEGSIKYIGTEVSNNKIQKVLLLAGSGSIKQNGVYQQTIDSLERRKIEVVEVWGVRPNPTLEHAREVIEIIKKENVEGIVAVGGGSVIDEAKSVAAGVFVQNLWDIFEKKVVIRQALPVFVILTLSATGTEMNPYAVLSNEAELKKWSFGSPLVYPKVSIIDPSVQATLPQRQTANGGVDSLSHLMENYFMGELNAEISLALNEATQRTVIKQVDLLMDNPNNYEARANLAWSSTIALNGMTSIALSGGEWTTHAMEHALSVINPQIAHAEGLAVMFPAWIKYVYDAKPYIFERWAKNVWNANSVLEGVEAMQSKFRSWGSPTTLTELGFGRSDFPQLVKCIVEYGRVGRVKILEPSDFEKILELAL